MVPAAGVAPGAPNSELTGTALDLEQRLLFLSSERRLDLEQLREPLFSTPVVASPLDACELHGTALVRCAALFLSTGSSAGSNLPAEILLVVLGCVGGLIVYTGVPHIRGERRPARPNGPHSSVRIAPHVVG
ncbi:hypothetical protein MRX96_053486 [Rhipicephalus microplus]